MEETHVVGSGKVCKCPHHKVVPILIILIGLDFLLGATGTLGWNFVDVTWPILLIIGGATKLGGCSAAQSK